MTEFGEYVERATRQHGHKLDLSELPEKFQQHYNDRTRIRVAGPMGVRTGRVGITTGWRPAFLLMHRSNAISSWDVLSERDQIVAVKVGRHYVDVR